jgi:hypothetical protein
VGREGLFFSLFLCGLDRKVCYDWVRLFSMFESIYGSESTVYGREMIMFLMFCYVGVGWYVQTGTYICECVKL